MSNALPVTYSWENIEVFLDIPQGNCFSRMQNKTPPIQKRILDNGIKENYKCGSYKECL